MFTEVWMAVLIPKQLFAINDFKSRTSSEEGYALHGGRLKECGVSLSLIKERNNLFGCVL